MNGLSKKIEFLASISILVVAIFLSELLIHKYIFSSPTSDIPQIQAERASNSRIELPNFDWGERPKTLVLALQTSCRYCNLSAPFYKRLMASTAGKNVRFVAVIPGDIQKSQAHMEKLGLKDLDIRAATLESIQVDGTPTLLLVNDKGQVINYWVGRLPADKEAEVISNLNS